MQTPERAARAKRLSMKGEVLSRSDADALLARPGDAVLVRRGRLRSIVIACPDGCGDVLTINLDPRAGLTWRLHAGPRGTTVFPSIWRDTGCKSHFIVWRDAILWTEAEDYADVPPGYEAGLEARVLAAARPDVFLDHLMLAERAGEDPWEVLWACRSLVRKGDLVQGGDRGAPSFRRLQRSWTV